jgi:HSP90 family molecular chaperone
MAKLKSFLTKRVLKFLKDEAEKNPEDYSKWYENFSMFIKEGSMDPDFKKDVIDLNRYEITGETGVKTLKDYIKLKSKTQDRIFYTFAPNATVAKDSPYVYPLAKAGIPVLIAPTHIDEFIFKEIDTYEGLKFSNIETDHDDVERAIKGAEEANPEKKEEDLTEGIKEEDITGFSLWIKNELQPFVDKVVVSKKKISGPALVISPLSASMRQMAIMRKMMEDNAKVFLLIILGRKAQS